MAEAPFTGEYPTRSQVEQALTEVGFSEYADRIVTPPMGNSVPGQLADKLTECKSSALATHWPIMFKHGVRGMLEKSGVVILD